VCAANLLRVVVALIERDTQIVSSNGGRMGAREGSGRAMGMQGKDLACDSPEHNAFAAAREKRYQ